MRTDEFEDLIGAFSKVGDANKKSDEDAKRLEADAFNIARHDGQVRTKLTIGFIRWFFFLLIFSCIFVLVYNWAVVHWFIDLKAAGLLDGSIKINFLELDKVLSIIIGALGTSLGFIIGYYFKEKVS